MQRVFRASRRARHRGWSDARRRQQAACEVHKFRRAVREAEHAQMRGQPIARQIERIGRRAEASDLRIQRLEGLVEVQMQIQLSIGGPRFQYLSNGFREQGSGSVWSRVELIAICERGCSEVVGHGSVMVVRSMMEAR